MKKLSTLLAATAATSLFLSGNAALAADSIDFKNSMSSPSITTDQYFWNSCKASVGTTTTPIGEVQYDGTASLEKPSGKTNDSVLTCSVYDGTDSSINIGSFRAEIQENGSVVMHTDYCSTDPSQGFADCKYEYNSDNSSITVISTNS